MGAFKESAAFRTNSIVEGQYRDRFRQSGIDAVPRDEIVQSGALRKHSGLGNVPALKSNRSQIEEYGQKSSPFHNTFSSQFLIQKSHLAGFSKGDMGRFNSTLRGSGPTSAEV
jgi:hypothetical protein